MKTTINVDKATIARNRKTGRNDPPIIVRTYKGSLRAHEVAIDNDARVIYDPVNPRCNGAQVWIETNGYVEIIR